jgi:hypothetical protein
LLDQKGKKYVFINTFSLMKKYSKNQGRTMLLPTGLYAGPPFCRAGLFTTPVFDHPSVGGKSFLYSSF